jgi:hypothetical protein
MKIQSSKKLYLRSITRWLFIIVYISCCHVNAKSNNILINDLAIEVIEKEINVKCEVQYGVHEEIEIALINGIGMIFTLVVELRRERSYWLDPLITSVSKSFEIKYHALSEQFVVSELGEQTERSFPDLYSAFYNREHIDEFDLASIDQLDIHKKYYVRAKAQLVTEELPLPLRVKSYFSEKWRPSSGWSQWPI